MASLEHARIASLVSSVGEHIQDAVDLAERLTEGGEETAAASLYEAERSLQMAQRNLERAADALRNRS